MSGTQISDIRTGAGGCAANFFVYHHTRHELPVHGLVQGKETEKMKKNLKVLLVFNSPYFKPRGYDYKLEMSDPENMYTEKDILQALLANGYEVSILGLFNDVAPLFEEVKENRPDVIFNMVEMFNNKT